MKRDAFQAIADPTRREILSLIAYEPLNVNAVAGNFSVSRTAIYKHMKILQQCGMLKINKRGREHFCEAKLQKLREINNWVEQYRKFWNDKFDDLEDYLAELQGTSHKPKKSKKKK